MAAESARNLSAPYVFLAGLSEKSFPALGRDDCGTLEAGKCADIACFRIDDLVHAGIKDALAGLALAPPARAETVVVNGKVVVRGGRLLTGDEEKIARDVAAESKRLRSP